MRPGSFNEGAAPRRQPLRADERLRWWQTRWFAAGAALAATIPLWWPDVPPLVDLPGHMGRYRVQLSQGDHAFLREWYGFRWRVIGNLGVDLAIEPLSRVFGLELGVKLIAMAIPALIAAGLLWIAREAHGRVPGTALFALPLAYAYPIHFGFVNFALSMGLALPLFAWWLRLARQGRLRARAALFAPASCLLWLCHVFGWGVLGLLAFSAELVRRNNEARGERGVSRRWLLPVMRAGTGCLPLAPPVLLMLFWRTGGDVAGGTEDWFNWPVKLGWAAMILRDRWMGWDVASATVMYLILFKGVRDERLKFARDLGLSALLLIAVFILLPRIVFGSAYADMRLAPFAVAMALVAIRPGRDMTPRAAGALAMMGVLFFAARLAGTTASLALYDRSYDRVLAALPQVPVGSRVLALVGHECRNGWASSRLEHLPAMLLVRRMAFSNDQWSLPGAQLLTVRHAAPGFSHDPSQLVTREPCGEFWRPIDRALAEFPRDRFDHVWLIAPPPVDPRLLGGLRPVWSDGRDTLFRVERIGSRLSEARPTG